MYKFCFSGVFFCRQFFIGFKTVYFWVSEEDGRAVAEEKEELPQDTEELPQTTEELPQALWFKTFWKNKPWEWLFLVLSPAQAAAPSGGDQVPEINQPSSSKFSTEKITKDTTPNTKKEIMEQRLERKRETSRLWHKQNPNPKSAPWNL